MIKFFIFLFCINLSTNSFADNKVNYFKDIPIKNSNGFYQSVIEIESGENDKWEVIKKNGKIKVEKIDQEIPRKINYLSYPFNYGIIPQTILTVEDGGDGDPLDVVVLGEKIKRGSVIEINILGSINFIDSGDNDLKIIAIKKNNSIFKNIQDFDDLNNNYAGVIEIIKLWFLNYKGKNKVYYDQILNKDETEIIIKKSHKSFMFYINNLQQ
ncbi:MAG: inorganic diphosphatase [Pelagibacteraceae bacterium TMED232]|nr:MAG: inorganic diphosphatase [Pelagibacteraceae bacterium TMED232]|tara:strand:+ start:9461 stop:10096 length:636 start_codon:yes stop_codon:yes gene_type:complete